MYVDLRWVEIGEQLFGGWHPNLNGIVMEFKNDSVELHNRAYIRELLMPFSFLLQLKSTIGTLKYYITIVVYIIYQINHSIWHVVNRIVCYIPNQ